MKKFYKINSSMGYQIRPDDIVVTVSDRDWLIKSIKQARDSRVSDREIELLPRYLDEVILPDTEYAVEDVKIINFNYEWKVKLRGV